MNSFEFNKIAGAVLGTLLVVFGLQNLSGIIYHAEKPEKPGFAIEVAEAAETGEEAAPAEAAKPIAELLASADPAKGQAGTKACAACHDLSNANTNKVGPGLWNVVERPVASHEGFAYSDALKAKGGTWTYEDLNKFLTNPKAAVPGTKMGFAGIKDDAKRADVILMRMGEHEAMQARFLGGDEADVGQNHVDAGVGLLAELDAEVDHQPVLVIGRPVAIDVAVHADLPGAAEGEIDQPVRTHAVSSSLL